MLRICYLIFILSGLLTLSCTQGYILDTVSYNTLLNDGNSKVWVVNKQFIQGINVAPSNLKDKDVIIFFANGNCQIIPLKEIGKKEPDKGTYEMNSKSKEITFDFYSKSHWAFNFAYITEDSIRLNAKSSSELKNDIQIIPLPEL